jgi:hypothetical protein
MMFKKSLIAIAVLGAATTVVHAGDAARKDPKTGKNCVTMFSSEPTSTGLTRINFRNTCDSPFRVEIDAVARTRSGSIEAGTPEKPSKASVTCKADERCEAAKWTFN